MKQLSLFQLEAKQIVMSSLFDLILDELGIDDNSPGWPNNFGGALHQWALGTIEKPIKVLSLFTGGGGLDIGFHDCGFQILEMVEIETKYVETLKLNTKEGGRLYGAKPICIDIRNYKPPISSDIDFIIGGPPCQTFSAAGRRAAGVAGLSDPRGLLFREYVRILGEVKPKGFLFENVYGITGAQNGTAWKEIISSFEDAGYHVSFRILDAADYGVPQHRERLIIVGLREGKFLFPKPTHGPDSINNRPYYSAGLAVKDVFDEKPGEVSGRYGYLLRDIPPGLNYSFYTEEMGHPNPVFSWRSKFSDFLYKADPNEPVRTIKAQGGQYTGPFHWDNRPFSLEELKRLQTFPDNYKLAGGKLVAIEQIGNSVPPQFGRILALSVLQQVFGYKIAKGIDLLYPDVELGFRRRKSLLTGQYRKKARVALEILYGESIPAKNGFHSRNNIEAHNSQNEIFQDKLGFLGPQFLWIVSGSSDQKLHWNVKFSILNHDDSLILRIRAIEKQSDNAALILQVKPNPIWILPYSKIKLEINALIPFLYTAAWKSLESIIAEEGTKADLVQLNGYYQYKPKIKINVEAIDDPYVTEKPHLWMAVTSVVEGVGVRTILSIQELAKLWELPVSDTIDALLDLKSMGYEIRSEYTNSQIPQGSILIPYAFPTLNPKSVQLRKSLFPND